MYPAPTSTTTPRRQSRSVCRGGTRAARRPGREPRRPSSQSAGTPFQHGSRRGVHGLPAFTRLAANHRRCSILKGGPDISGPYEYHHPTPGNPNRFVGAAHVPPVDPDVNRTNRHHD